MQFVFPAFAVLIVACVGSAGESNAQEPGTRSVTTEWLPDPFPNTPPIAQDRYATVEADVPARTPSVLLGMYDVENDALSVASFQQPAHGAAVLNQDGTFTYTPQSHDTCVDQFTFTISDGRGGESSATMRIRVVKPTGAWSTTSFVDLAEVCAEDRAIVHGSRTTVPRAVDWTGDGKVDLLVGAGGNVWLYRNVGTTTAPRFATGTKLRSGDGEVQAGMGRVAIALADMNRDGRPDLVVIGEPDRKVRWWRDDSAQGEPALAAASILKTTAGDDFVVEDLRADVADWNGDGLPDIVTGSRSGSVKIAYNQGTPSSPAFAQPTTVVDADGRQVEGSYNLNVRIVDINQDGMLDLVDTYNWGTIHFRINAGSSAQPRLPVTGAFSVTGPDDARVDLHALCDGPIVDFADFNGDGTIDLVMGGEIGGKVRLAFGQSGESYLDEIRRLIAAHPLDLGTYLNDPANASAKERMRTLQGALYDYVVGFATPEQKTQIGRGLVALISDFPQYFRLQQLDVDRQPGMPSLAVQTWLTLLMVGYDDPAARHVLADAAHLTGGYRRLVEDVGLIYADNGQNPRGAEAIYQWVRTIPREVYPGTCLTAADWLGGREFLVRGHMKNTFNGHPVDRGEYGFGPDARRVIGSRGSENWFMTVVHHEACHDLDAYVRKSPDLSRRWGQTLVLAGGPDMRADPDTGWLSWERTRQHFRDAGLWNGTRADWDAAWERYWMVPPGSEWRQFGFMRGNIPWFYAAPQESLATQGNQYWNSTEGRIQVAIDRWQRGYKSNLTEVLFFMDIWSLGRNKIKFYENDNACNQVISFAQLRRNRRGYIERIDLADRYYEFIVDENGVVTDVVHAPALAE
ncbi:MAG: FG-GAP-like repeat-containing protein [Planctomycetes bacterium]|nr:FG-GAP-like repeat-containing protein [Planctomycetota bacterium]